MINVRKINASQRLINISKFILIVMAIWILFLEAGRISAGELNQYTCAEIEEAVREGEDLELGGFTNKKALSSDILLYYTTQCIETRCIKVGGRDFIPILDEKPIEIEEDNKDKCYCIVNGTSQGVPVNFKKEAINNNCKISYEDVYPLGGGVEPFSSDNLTITLSKGCQIGQGGQETNETNK